MNIKLKSAISYNPGHDALLNTDLRDLILQFGNHRDLTRAFNGEVITEPPPDELQLMLRLGVLFYSIYKHKDSITIPLSPVVKKSILDTCWFLLSKLSRNNPTKQD